MYRDAILAAAEAEFTDRGYAASRMIDVAHRAGLSVGALYRHFASKEVLFTSLVARGRDQIHERLAAVAAATADPAPRIAGLIATLLEYVEENRAMFLMFDELAGADRDRCGAMVEAADVTRECVFDVFRDALADATAAGALRADVAPPDQLALVSGAMHGFLQTWIRSGAATGLADKAPLIAQLTLRALGGPA